MVKKRHFFQTTNIFFLNAHFLELINSLFFRFSLVLSFTVINYPAIKRLRGKRRLSIIFFVIEYLMILRRRNESDDKKRKDEKVKWLFRFLHEPLLKELCKNLLKVQISNPPELICFLDSFNSFNPFVFKLFAFFHSVIFLFLIISFISLKKFSFKVKNRLKNVP